MYQALSFTFFYIAFVKGLYFVNDFFYYDISLFFVFQRFENKSFQFFCQFRIVLYANFCRVASLTKFGVIVAIP